MIIVYGTVFGSELNSNLRIQEYAESRNPVPIFFAGNSDIAIHFCMSIKLPESGVASSVRAPAVKS